MSKTVDKLRQKAIRDQQKRIKPGECQKYVRLVLDSSLTHQSYGQELIQNLNKEQIQYDIRSLAEKACILWERNVGQRTINMSEPSCSAVCLSDQWEVENQMVRLLSSQEFQNCLKTNKLLEMGERLRLAFPEMKHTILLLSSSGKDKSSTAGMALLELQMMHQLAGIQQIAENAFELMGFLKRFTKAIAEAPFKQQKGAQLSSFKKFLANDKKQCVRIESGSGYGRLWQQHLNRLPQVTLEVAETIIAQYSCPKKLLAAYENKTEQEGMSLVADLKINRGAAVPFQTDRRIGSVMSGKLYTLYNCRDANTCI